LENFTIFSNLPIELRLNIWGHSLPRLRVFEIQWSQQYKAWQFVMESKPSMPPLHEVNKEARGELLRSYKAISLEARADSQVIPKPAPSFRCFFSPARDTLYIVTAPGSKIAYSTPTLRWLNGNFRNCVRHLAVLGEHLSSAEFDNGSPYNVITLATKAKAIKLGGVIGWIPQIKTLSVVVGDDFSLAPGYLAVLSGLTRKPNGEVELTELTTREFVGAEEQLHSWIQFLLDHFPDIPNQPAFGIRQSMRRGKFAVVDVWGFLDD
ncbi:hypothetical protein N431DRAFT_348846, partial [Stipitochalara longipes BDJ]